MKLHEIKLFKYIPCVNKYIKYIIMLKNHIFINIQK
jgi:hypothetical protein